MAEPILVQKYGGSSVANPEKLMQVAQRVVDARKQGYRVVVVVSAMGDTTNRLMQMAKEISDNPPRRELDMLLSVGERVSMALLSMAIQKLGYDSISFTGSQCGIITNDRHFDARIIEVRPIRIQDELERDKVVIVAGYQGMSYKREITTLGRGGSDTTAVALAAALGAQVCEICSDVDGVYRADPRHVTGAEKLDEISYREMETLARAGAKVLHADAVAWARKHGVVLYARATAEPFAQGGGTLIRRDLDNAEQALGLPYITGTNDLIWLQIPSTPERQLAVAQWLSTCELVPLWTDWRDDQIDIFFRQFETTNIESAMMQLERLTNIHSPTRKVASVSLIGDALTRDLRWLHRAWRCLQLDCSPPVAIHKVYTEPIRISFIIPIDDLPLAQQQLYRILSAV